jgi:hypothetical protein
MPGFAGRAIILSIDFFILLFFLPPVFPSDRHPPVMFLLRKQNYSRSSAHPMMQVN